MKKSITEKKRIKQDQKRRKVEVFFGLLLIVVFPFTNAVTRKLIILVSLIMVYVSFRQYRKELKEDPEKWAHLKKVFKQIPTDITNNNENSHSQPEEKIIDFSKETSNQSTEQSSTRENEKRKANAIVCHPGEIHVSTK